MQEPLFRMSQSRGGYIPVPGPSKTDIPVEIHWPTRPVVIRLALDRPNNGSRTNGSRTNGSRTNGSRIAALAPLALILFLVAFTLAWQPVIWPAIAWLTKEACSCL